MNGDLAQEFAYIIAKLTLEKTLREVRMTTGLEITGTIQSIRAAIGLAKSITEVAKKLDNAELIRLIADLNLEMADANLKLANINNELAEMKQGNLQLREQIRKLESDQSRNRPLIKSDNGMYFTDDGEGPFCPNCYNNSERTLMKISGNIFIPTKFECQKCCWTKSLLWEGL